MICIVTAYLDIQRSEWKTFRRTSEDYIQNFLPYLRMKEEMVVFIDDKWHLQLEKLVLESGKKNILLIPINKEWMEKNIELWSYLPVEKHIMNTDIYRRLINGKTNPEYNIPEYNSIQHSKVDFVKYVIDNNLSNCQYYCWSDFGFFGDKNKELPKDTILDIDKFITDKINYCLINDIENSDGQLLNTLVNPRETIGGFFFLADKKTMIRYNQVYKEILLSDFYEIGIVDDDQHVVLRCVLKYPDLFCLHLNGWHNVYNKYYKNIEKKFSIAMPLSNNDINRFIKVALPKYKEHLNTRYLDSFIVICQDKDLVKSKINEPNIPFVFLSENEFNLKEDLLGLIKQQILKLEVSHFIKTDVYIVVDADMYLVKNLDYEDLFMEGRIKYSSEPYQEFKPDPHYVNKDWIFGSCKAVEYPKEKLTRYMSVTPQTLYKPFVLEMLEELGDLNKVFVESKPSEFLMYWFFLLKKGYTCIYKDATENFPLWKGDCSRNVLENLSIDKVQEVIQKAENKPTMYFCTLQSHIIDVD